jgi:hypothetical protein
MVEVHRRIFRATPFAKALDGLDPEPVVAAARAALASTPMRPVDLGRHLAARFPDRDPSALAALARYHLPLVQVPPRGLWRRSAQVTLTTAEAWVGSDLAASPSLDDVVLRYLAAFGPATVADVQTWSGLPGMKPVLERMRPRLCVFRDERRRDLFDLPEAPRPDESVPAPPRFLPEFDNLVLAHADRSRVLADEHRSLVVTRNLRVRATFLWDGFVRGTWEVERKQGSATLRLAPFEPLPERAATELAAEGEALLRFFEEDATELEVEIGRDAGRAG